MAPETNREVVMRALALVVVVLILSGCGSPTPTDPPAADREKGKDKKGEPVAKKLSLAEAQALVVGEKGMKRADVKKLLGAPDETREGKFGPNRFHSEEWIYRKQAVIIDGATEKPYPTIRVVFLKDTDNPAEDLQPK